MYGIFPPISTIEVCLITLWSLCELNMKVPLVTEIENAGNKDDSKQHQTCNERFIKMEKKLEHLENRLKSIESTNNYASGNLYNSSINKSGSIQRNSYGRLNNGQRDEQLIRQGEDINDDPTEIYLFCILGIIGTPFFWWLGCCVFANKAQRRGPRRTQAYFVLAICTFLSFVGFVIIIIWLT